MGMRRSPAPLHMPMPFPLRGKAWILKSNQMKSEVFSLRLLLCEPSVELCLLLFDDHIDAGVLELLVELRESLENGRIIIRSNRDRMNPMTPRELLKELRDREAEQRLLLTEQDKSLLKV